MQGVERYNVKLLPHDKMWEVEFVETKIQIQDLWKDNITDIQHFGSTSIKGILAKPIPDVAVVLKSFANMDIEAMVQAGYDYRGLQEPNNDRHLYVLRGDNEISLRHIHCYEPNNTDFEQCMHFRDYLNNHQEKAHEYSELKYRLAEQFPNDRSAYAAAKESFIDSIYNELRQGS